MEGIRGFDQLFARERLLVMRARHAEAISRRWGFVLLLAGLAIFGGVMRILAKKFLGIVRSGWIRVTRPLTWACWSIRPTHPRCS